MFVKSLFSFLICVSRVSNNITGVESISQTNKFIKIAEVNSTYINNNTIYFWKAGTEHIVECTILNSTEDEHIKCFEPTGSMIEKDQSAHIFVENYSTELVKDQRVTALRLSFNLTTVEDSGVWRCQSADGSRMQNFSVCINEKIIVVSKTKKYYFPRRGYAITLKCNAFVQFAPLFQWYRNGDPITDDYNDKYKISYKYTRNYLISTLTVTNVGDEDNGVYICKAIGHNPLVGIDCKYTDTLNLTVKVKYAPTFESTKAEFYSIAGESENIRCEADGYPEPKYTWFRHINGSNRLELVDNTANLNLTIDESSFGFYTCHAANFEGDATKIYVIKKMLKPRSPDNVYLNNIGTSKTLTLNWRDDIKYPIQGIDIEYINDECKIERISNWISATKMSVKVNEGQYNFNNFLTLNLSLNEDKVYCIRVRVTNKAGNSSWSNLITAYNAISLGFSYPVTSIFRLNYQQFLNILTNVLRIILASIYSVIIYMISYF